MIQLVLMTYCSLAGRTSAPCVTLWLISTFLYLMELNSLIWSLLPQSLESMNLSKAGVRQHCVTNNARGWVGWLFQVPVRRRNTIQEILLEPHIQHVLSCIRQKDQILTMVNNTKKQDPTSQQQSHDIIWIFDSKVNNRFTSITSQSNIPGMWPGQCSTRWCWMALWHTLSHVQLGWAFFGGALCVGLCQCSGVSEMNEEAEFIFFVCIIVAA